MNMQCHKKPIPIYDIEYFHFQNAGYIRTTNDDPHM